jgi:protocatechuate 3,4-dioxygenase, alpha subunit
MLEFWQPDAALSDVGMLRVPTDAEGRYEVRLPKAIDGAPLAYVCVFARGLLNHYFTAVFADGGASGELWSQIPEGRRDSVVAKRVSVDQMQWDVRLQGANETVFFEYR